MYLPRLIFRFLFVVVPAVLAQAQGTFHFKIDSLHSAYGLAVMPDSTIIAGGSLGDCLQIFRLSPEGEALWSKKICALNETENFEKNSLQIIPGIENGSFFAGVRYRSDVLGPQHVIDLMKFDAGGHLEWECQLPPYVSFGASASGSQLAVAPDGTVWAVHGIGVSQFSPMGQSFNQVLLFKVAPTGELQFRNSYFTDVESNANGVFVRGNDEVFVYGGLEQFLVDGFLLKIRADGSLAWSKKYKNFYFYRDGGQFANGDELLYGTTPEGVAFARIRPADGSMVWLKKIGLYPEPGLFTVAPDQGVFANVRVPGAGLRRAVLKCAPDLQTVEWLRRYEDCTDYLVLDALSTPDGGLVFTQNGAPIDQTRLLKVNAAGQFEPGCASWDLPLPPISDLSVVTPQNLFFGLESGPIPVKKNIISVVTSAVRLVDVCPGGYPEALLAVPDSACAGSATRLEDSGNANADTWQWLLPGAGELTTHGPVAEPVVYAQQGIFPVTLIRQYGVCTDTVQDSIRVAAPLTADLFAYDDTLHCLEQPFTALPQALPFDTWQWDDGSTAPQRVLDPPLAGIYRLTAQKGLCRVTDSITLRLKRCETADLFVPNVFAPESQGDNARWEVSLHPGSTLLSCSVYDRWGALVYATAEGELPDWEGTHQGKKLPAGVYAWVIRLRKADGTEETRFGDLSLLR